MDNEFKKTMTIIQAIKDDDFNHLTSLIDEHHVVKYGIFMNVAAEYGRLNMVVFLDERNHPWGIEACMKAVFGGTLNY